MMASTSDGFDWRDEDLVVLRGQPPTAVYYNTANEVVIRQQDEDADTFLIVQAVHAQRVARAIAAVGAYVLRMKERERHESDCIGDALDDEPETPKDRTGAERQRRYRERQRNGVTEGTRDSERDTTSEKRDEEDAVPSLFRAAE